MLLPVLSPSLARADPSVAAARPRFETRGLSVQLEAGRYDGGVGTAWVFYFPLPVPRLTVGAELGWGYTGAEPRGLAGRAHGFVAYGSDHRAVLVAGYAVADRDRLRLHGIPAAEQTYWGPDLSVGYELLTASGANVRALVGGSYVRRPTAPSGSRLKAMLVLALGWKFL